MFLETNFQRLLSVDGDGLHTAISRTRSPSDVCTGPISTDRHPSIASRMFFTNSSTLSPSEAHPGMAGTSPQKPPSSALWITTLSFIAFDLRVLSIIYCNELSNAING